MSLSVREQLFVAALVKGASQTAAAIEAGYAKRSARQQGSALMTKPYIRAAIEKANVSIEAKAEITRVKVLTDLERRGWKAEDLEQMGAAIRASELQGRELGMFAEKLVLEAESDRRKLLAAVEPEGEEIYLRVLARIHAGTAKALRSAGGGGGGGGS